ncbi:MAG: hypothetical protein ACOCPW_00670 [Marinilabiliaceae bacterium]
MTLIFFLNYWVLLMHTLRGHWVKLIFLLVLLSSGSGNSVYGCDEPSETKGRDFISVYLDFPYYTQYIRESLPIMNYVRDRQLSQVQIKISRHRAGSAGTNYVINLIGRQQFEGMNNEITYWDASTNSSDETRKGLLEKLKLGLAPYLANTDMKNEIGIHIPDSLVATGSQEMDDPWNHWVFEIYGGANYSEESTQSKFNSRWGFYADKISEDWKIRIRPYFNLNESSYSSDEEEEDIVSKNYRHGFNGYMIRSLDQNWSAGLFVDMLSSTFHNMDFNIETTPGVEYSIYPYSEATSRSITFAYLLGAARNYYMEETIFMKNQEDLMKQALKISVDFDQPWGSIRGGVTGSHYFHDFDVNRLEVYSRLDLNLVEGLSLNFHSNLDLVNDLISIPGGDASLEEILLEERARSTSYQIFTSIGLSYSFGSDFSNTVNTRF